MGFWEPAPPLWPPQPESRGKRPLCGPRPLRLPPYFNPSGPGGGGAEAEADVADVEPESPRDVGGEEVEEEEVEEEEVEEEEVEEEEGVEEEEEVEEVLAREGGVWRGWSAPPRAAAGRCRARWEGRRSGVCPALARVACPILPTSPPWRRCPGVVGSVLGWLP